MLGFLPVATTFRRLCLHTTAKVSIPCWVFCPSRPNRGPDVIEDFERVSIPCWVFCPSRLDLLVFGLAHRQCFNPVLGFLPVATAPVFRSATDPRRFQSRAGFSARRDLGTSTPTPRPTAGFNPVLGFLPVATRGENHDRYDTTVSIPCWVFCPSRRYGQVLQGNRRVVVSIPCWVFCPSRQRHPRPPGRRGRCFNPVLGFLPVATYTRNVQDVREIVSIPCWVFCPSRPGGGYSATGCIVVSHRVRGRARFVNRGCTPDLKGSMKDGH